MLKSIIISDPTFLLINREKISGLTSLVLVWVAFVLCMYHAQRII